MSKVDEIADVGRLKLVYEELASRFADARIRDVVDHEDFSEKLDSQLAVLSSRLSAGTYRPQGILTADFPKSPQSTRPIAMPRIEDAVIYQAIAKYVHHIVDPQLSRICRSLRLRQEVQGRDEKKQGPVLQTEYWFEAWPEYLVDSERLAKSFRYVLLLDLAVYYENIDYDILRSLIVKYGVDDSAISNLLIELLRGWSWRNPEGFKRDRGIPQQFEASALVGNMYLDPMDRILESLVSGKGEAVRWMDEYRIFVNDFREASRIAQRMGTAARDLMLNLNESKTVILKGPFTGNQLAQREFGLGRTGSRVVRVANQPLKRRITKTNGLKQIKWGLRKLWEDYEQGVWGKYTHEVPFKRVLTVLKFFRDGYAVERSMRILWQRPHLAIDILEYLGIFPENKEIFDFLVRGAVQGKCVCDFQEALVVRTLAGFQRYSKALHQYALRTSVDFQRHWYLRCQVVGLLGKIGTSAEIAALSKLLPRFEIDELQRYCLVACTRLEKKTRDSLFDLASGLSSPALSRLVLHMRHMTSSSEACTGALEKIRAKPRWDQYLYRMFLVRDVESKDVQLRLLDQVMRKLRNTSDPTLKSLLGDLATTTRSSIARLT